jgi:hypothetical protein
MALWERTAKFIGFGFRGFIDDSWNCFCNGLGVRCECSGFSLERFGWTHLPGALIDSREHSHE